MASGLVVVQLLAGSNPVHHPKAKEAFMKPRNTIMALVSKNDPTRYHTRSVEAEHIKLQRNRARRRAKERREICEGSSMVEHEAVAFGTWVRFPPCTPIQIVISS